VTLTGSLKSSNSKTITAILTVIVNLPEHIYGLDS